MPELKRKTSACRRTRKRERQHGTDGSGICPCHTKGLTESAPRPHQTITVSTQLNAYHGCPRDDEKKKLKGEKKKECGANKGKVQGKQKNKGLLGRGRGPAELKPSVCGESHDQKSNIFRKKRREGGRDHKRLVGTWWQFRQ